MCAWSSAAGRGCFGKTRVRQVCLATVGCCRTALGDGEPGTGETNGRAPGASALHLAVLGGHLVFAQAREICATKQTDVGNEKEEMLNWTASLDYQYNIGSNYYIYIYIKINKIIYIYIYPYFDHTHTFACFLQFLPLCCWIFVNGRGLRVGESPNTSFCVSLVPGTSECPLCSRHRRCQRAGTFACGSHWRAFRFSLSDLAAKQEIHRNPINQGIYQIDQ